MNSEQLKSIVRSVLIAVSAGAGGWAASKGWSGGAETIRSILTNETVIGFIVAAASAWWGVQAKTSANLIVSASAVPEVKSVTVNDVKLAKAVDARGAEANIVVRPS